jgi:hypothetical protein
MKMVTFGSKPKMGQNEALQRFSEGKMDSDTAMRVAGFKSYRELLDALGKFGFPYPELPEDKLKKMSSVVRSELAPDKCILAVPDSGPLISLAKIDKLELLLKLDMPIFVMDEVYNEIVGNQEYDPNWKIGEFLTLHAKLEPTNAGKRALALRKNGKSAGKYCADEAILEFLRDRVEKFADMAGNVLLLFEDHKMRRAFQFLFPANIFFLSTAGFLRGLQERRIIENAGALIDQLTLLPYWTTMYTELDVETLRNIFADAAIL